MISESKPIFVKIDKYKEIIEIVEVINKKVAGVKQLLAEFEELRTKEEEELNNWEKNLDEITHKIELMKEELSSE
jgi:tetrahydromethanopterin S-methyltransferase subunit G